MEARTKSRRSRIKSHRPRRLERRYFETIDGKTVARRGGRKRGGFVRGEVDIGDIGRLFLAAIDGIEQKGGA